MSCQIDVLHNNLKSSLDRFIVDEVTEEQTEETHLKSSLDRFIALEVI